MKKTSISRQKTPMAEIYFNNPQRRTQLIGANTTVIVAGRRTGKTDSIASPFVLRNMQRMPGSTGGIVVPTFKHGLTNTIPGLLAAWKRWGFLNGVHYVVGRKPPKGFQTAIIEPTDYEHVISFYNGSRAIIISQDRPGSSNSLTLSWLLIDEAKFIDYERLKDETLPANGGIKSYFGKHSFNHSILILSDMPQTKKGSWFLHYEQKMDRELIATIEATICEIWRVKQRIKADRKAGKTPPEYLRKHLRHLDKQLNQMRSVAVYYKEYSSIENLQLLGETYIKQMKRDLREKLYMARNTVCTHDNSENNLGICKRLVNLRREIAQLLGYRTYADYVLKHRMASKVKNVYNLLYDLIDAYKPTATKEYEQLENMAKKMEGKDFEMRQWDQAFYSHKLQLKKYNLDAEMLRPYFELSNVIKGVFGLATRLYGSPQPPEWKPRYTHLKID